MENLHKLLILPICLGLVTLLYVPLIPSWEAVRAVQINLKKLNRDQIVDLREVTEEDDEFKSQNSDT